MLTVRAATEADAVSLGPRLREADLRELQAIHGDAAVPEDSLRLGVESPDGCYVAVDDNDTPQIIFGTHPSGDPLVGFIWMMGSDAIVKHRRQLFKETLPLLHKIAGKYPLLTNCVHADNTAHIRWIQWAGFVILRELSFNGHTFYEFARLMNGDTHKEKEH